MRRLIGDLRIKTCLVNQNPAEICQVFGKNAMEHNLLFDFRPSPNLSREFR